MVIRLILMMREMKKDKKRQEEGIRAVNFRGVKFGRSIKKVPDNFDFLIKQWKHQSMNGHKAFYFSFYR